MKDLINRSGQLSKKNPILNYLSQLFLLNTKAVFYPLSWLELKSPINFAVKLRNVKCILGGFEQRFGYNEELNLYFVNEGSVTQYFHDRERGFTAYSLGILSRSENLASSYFVDSIENIQSSDIVIDCGANYGDLYHLLSSILKPESYIAFEPGLEEYRCLSMNTPFSRIYNSGLGDRNGIYPFFVYNSNGNADSSFIQPHAFESIRMVEMRTLDEVIEELKLERIKLLKIEAEGAEPEVLQGDSKNLSKIEYIAIDGGFERGVDEAETLTTCTNFLVKHNFDLVKLSANSMKALYRRNDTSTLW